MPMMQTQRGRVDPLRSLVGFHVGPGYYAVDVPSVREIIQPANLTNVPASASILLGVIDHRGRVVPVVDLRRRFGLGAVEPNRRTKWILVEAVGLWFGLCVDNVTEVFGVGPEHERAAPNLGPDEVSRGFSRVYVYERQIVMVLDLEAIARAVERGGVALPPALPGFDAQEAER